MQAVVYTKENCQWCDRVKQLFKAVEIDYLEYKYNTDFNKKQFNICKSKKSYDSHGNNHSICRYHLR